MKIVRPVACLLRGSACALGLLLIAQCGDGADIALEDAASMQQNTLQDTSSCNVSGTWAVKFSIPVRWSPSIVVSGGQGTVYQWLKAERTQNGNTYTDHLTLCGISPPDSKTRPIFGNELYGVSFPNTLFDSDILPKFDSHTSLTTPDGALEFRTDPLTVLIGTQMPNPSVSSWPSAKLMSTIDHDNDGMPGITINVRTDHGHTPPPVDMWRRKRAAKFYIALRNVVDTATGRFSDCDHAQGTVTIPLIDNKLAINSRVLGCQRTDGSPCTTAEYEMVDKQSSGYDLNGPARVEMTRMPANVTCETVRGL